MELFGVVNASPDSLNTDSVVDGTAEATARIRQVLAEGASGIDVGGQGSTGFATLAECQIEWERVQPALTAAIELCDDVSIDTFRLEVAEQALSAGATTLNAANGMQDDKFWALAAEHEAKVVVPFINGPDPFNLTHVIGDPIDRMLEYFEDRLRVADRFGLRDRCLIDPGTGFGPHGWDWAERFVYQKQVYGDLGRLRSLGLPLYIPFPWKDTADHRLLLDLVLAQRPEYGRAHYPATIIAAADRLEALNSLD